MSSEIKMPTLPVLLFLTQSGGRSAKNKCKQTNFSKTFRDFYPRNWSLVYRTECLQAERKQTNSRYAL